MISIRFLLAAAWLSCTSILAAQVAVEDFARLPEVSQFRLSPDGTRMSAKMVLAGKQVVVARSISGTEAPGLLAFSNVHISDYAWVNNELLVLSLRGTVGMLGGIVNVTRLASVSRQGKDLRFFKMRPNIHELYRQHPDVVSMLPDEPDYILATLNDDERKWDAPEINRVNVATGSHKRIQRNRKSISEWVTDKDGQVRVGIAFDSLPSGKRGVMMTWYHRETTDGQLQVVQKLDYFDKDLLIPVRFHPEDPNILLVANDHMAQQYDAGEDQVLFEYDLQNRVVKGRYISVMLTKIRQMADAQLGPLRVEIVSKARDVPRYIIVAYSDVRPARYYLYDDTRPGFHLVGGAYPHLESQQHSVMELIHYSARDGLRIPAYLTLPASAGEQLPPLVVYPHGGPWARDRWGFDNYVQFMASRGYAVFQPQFRGSTGFGLQHEVAGYGEWGKAIQDDITDGVEWLIKSGQVDPRRICIFGASFGGYAAAMGAARTPDLYQCAVSVNGVLDLKRFLNKGNRLLYEKLNRRVWNTRRDAENASPYHLTENISIPMLIIASSKDTVVPYRDHSKRFFKKYHARQPLTEYVELRGAEHWRTEEKHEISKMRALEKFLARHLDVSEMATTGGH